MNHLSDKEDLVGGQPDPLTPMDQKFATLDDLVKVTIDYS